MADLLRIPFHGEGSGVAELSWGQRDIWEPMRRQQSWLPIWAADRGVG